MAVNKFCWYCDFFKQTGSFAWNGECRKHPPNGLDSHVLNFGDLNDPVSTESVFPYVNDSRVEFCGDFKRASTDPGDPPS